MNEERDDTELQERFKLGAPAVQLKVFFDLLHDAYGLPSECDYWELLFQLLEKHGLLLHEKLIDGHSVPTEPLIATLKKRCAEEREALHRGVDEWESFDFWHGLGEANLWIARNDAETAFKKMGKAAFPWRDLGDDLSWLPINYSNRSTSVAQTRLESQAPAVLGDSQSGEGNVRTRKINLVRAIESAVYKLYLRLGHKPSLDELWHYFETEQDETGFIEDYTDERLTWRDTRGNLKDSPKRHVANHLSRIKI